MPCYKKSQLCYMYSTEWQLVGGGAYSSGENETVFEHDARVQIHIYPLLVIVPRTRVLTESGFLLLIVYFSSCITLDFQCCILDIQ